MNRLITDKKALLGAFPFSLTRDIDKANLADDIAEELIKTIILSNYASIFPRIDELPEEVLDILAYDLNVSWYEYEGTLDEKRKTIIECMQVHQYKGTKYAVETALRSIYDEVEVKEWFEYGGEPYCFKIIIRDSSNDRKKLAQVLEKVRYYKNVRSHLEETIFSVKINAALAAYAGARACGKYKRIYMEVKE